MGKFWDFEVALFVESTHTTYRKNNNHEKCAGIGLNGFISKNINEKYYIKVKKEPGSRLEVAC